MNSSPDFNPTPRLSSTSLTPLWGVWGLFFAATALVMALIMAFVRGWADNTFRVEIDERVEAILGILPGANCGGCGFMGCSDYAVAIVVDEEVTVQEPLDYVISRQEPLLEMVEVFDVFKSRQLGEGKRSIGYRLVYRSANRNLTDEEVNEIHSKLAENVLHRFNATLR